MASPALFGKRMASITAVFFTALSFYLASPLFPAEASNLLPADGESETAAAYIAFSSPAPQDSYENAEADLFYASYRNHSWDIPDEVIKTNDLWIAVDLTQQMLYVYRGSQLVTGFVVSTGVRSFKTVTGIYKIYAKYPAIDMRGPGYDLADVPFTMFFHKGYAIHGTYWHNNFGRPMSRGCINMVTEESAWLYEYVPVGAYVIVYY